MKFSLVTVFTTRKPKSCAGKRAVIRRGNGNTDAGAGRPPTMTVVIGMLIGALMPSARRCSFHSIILEAGPGAWFIV